MDCRTCQPTLLDLANGELAPELAESARAHLRGCEACSADFERLSQGVVLSRQLPWLEPPPDLTARIMAHAEQTARSKASKGAARERSQVSALQGLLDFVGRLASARQVAMATVMMLIVAVGMWSIPTLQRRPEAEGVTVVSPDPDGEAAPTSGIMPAEPLDLTVDARARRIRSRDEEAVARGAVPPAPAAEPQAEGLAKLEEASSGAKSKAAADELRLDDVDGVFAAEPPSKSTASPALAEGSAGLASVGQARAPSVQKGAPAPREAKAANAFPSSPAELAEQAYAAAPESEEAPGAAVATGGGASAPSPTATMEHAASARSLKKAAPSAPTQTAGSAAELLELARTRRKELGCAGALSSYEAVVRAAQGTAEAGAAMLELAECNYALGRTTAARAWAERATKSPTVAARARALLREHASKDAPAASTVESF